MTALQQRPTRTRRVRTLPFSSWHFLLAPVAVLFAIPFVQMFLTSVSPAAEINRFPPRFIPSTITFDGYAKLFDQSQILLWLGNTIIVAVAAIVSHLVLCSLAGYGFARLKFPGRNFGFFAVLATIMIPTQLLMIPTYIVFARIGLIDTLGAAIVPWLASAFGIFLMRQFFLSLPAELEEVGDDRVVEDDREHGRGGGHLQPGADEVLDGVVVQVHHIVI